MKQLPAQPSGTCAGRAKEFHARAGHPHPVNPFYAEITQAIIVRAKEEGYDVLASSVGNGGPEAEQHYVVKKSFIDPVLFIRKTCSYHGCLKILLDKKNTTTYVITYIICIILNIFRKFKQRDVVTFLVAYL